MEAPDMGIRTDGWRQQEYGRESPDEGQVAQVRPLHQRFARRNLHRHRRVIHDTDGHLHNKYTAR